MASSIGPVVRGYRRKRKNVGREVRAGNAPSRKRADDCERHPRRVSWAGTGGIRMRARIAMWGVFAAAALSHGGDPPIEKLSIPPRLFIDWTLPAGTPGERVKWVADRQKQLLEEFAKKYKATKADAEKEALFEREYPPPDLPAKLLLDLAAKNPKDPAAFDALLWVVQNSPRPPNQPDIPFARARDALMRDFARHP